MYHHIKGNLTAKNPSEAVIEAGGVGYLLYVSLNTFQDLPEAGNQARLLCHLHVKEDNLQLYGFSTPKERDVFRVLIAVSGIGPKLAMTVLSKLRPADLEQAVAHQDMTLLTAIPGIGKKTAERLLIELKGKIAEALVEGLPTMKAGTSAPADPAMEALMSLGLTYAEARTAVDKARAALGPQAPIDLVVRQALKNQ